MISINAFYLDKFGELFECVIQSGANGEPEVVCYGEVVTRDEIAALYVESECDAGLLAWFDADGISGMGVMR